MEDKTLKQKLEEAGFKVENKTVSERLQIAGFEGVYAPEVLDRGFIGLTQDNIAVYDESLIENINAVVNSNIVIVDTDCKEIDGEALLIGSGEEALALKPAIIGVSDDSRYVYDYDKLIECFMSYNNWTDDEAIEWYEVNTLRSLPYYPNAPYVVTNIDYII